MLIEEGANGQLLRGPVVHSTATTAGARAHQSAGLGLLLCNYQDHATRTTLSQLL